MVSSGIIVNLDSLGLFQLEQLYSSKSKFHRYFLIEDLSFLLFLKSVQEFIHDSKAFLTCDLWGSQHSEKIALLWAIVMGFKGVILQS